MDCVFFCLQVTADNQKVTGGTPRKNPTKCEFLVARPIYEVTLRLQYLL